MDSTVEYQQEDFTTYQCKVLELVLSLFTNHSARDITIMRMKDGGFNRIIGITITSPELQRRWYSPVRIWAMLLSYLVRPRTKPSRLSQKFILRIGRGVGKEPSIPHQVATLAYLSRRLRYPVPKAMASDSTASNAISSPYILQERVPGQSLDTLWSELNSAQRRSAAKDIACIIRDLAKFQNNNAGIISTRNSNHDINRDAIHIEPTPVPFTHITSDSGTLPALATPQTTYEYLMSLCNRHQAYAKSVDNSPFPKLWARIYPMINKLYKLGCIPDSDVFHLYHGDLQPRNLLAEIVNKDTVRITAIIDWDLAHFAHNSMAYRAPFFLYKHDDSFEEDENDALLTPTDAELVAHKRIFEKVVGEEFCKEAYRPELVLARRLFHMLLSGITSGTATFYAEEILDEWEAYIRKVGDRRVFIG